MKTPQNLIDVSHHNGVIDWEAVKKDKLNIAGAIIRAGYGRDSSQKDRCFETNYAGAVKAGLPVGAYWYSYAKTPADAVTEAKTFLRAIKGKQFLYPLYYDIEDTRQIKLSKKLCTDMVRSFCSCLETNGYFAGVYSFDNFFASNLSSDIPERFSAWAARIGSKPKCVTAYAAWQYSWKGKVDGIAGDVDLNEFYQDFPKIMRGKHLNGC